MGALALTVIGVPPVTSAIADEDEHHHGWGHDWRGERYGRYGEWYGYRRPYDYWRPPYTRPYFYGPPPVIYAPPPVYYPPPAPPGINLIIPLHIR